MPVAHGVGQLVQTLGLFQQAGDAGGVSALLAGSSYAAHKGIHFVVELFQIIPRFLAQGLALLVQARAVDAEGLQTVGNAFQLIGHADQAIGAGRLPLGHGIRQHRGDEVDHLLFDVVGDVFQVIDAVEGCLVVLLADGVVAGQVEHLAGDLDHVVHFQIGLLQRHFRRHGHACPQILELVHFLFALAGHHPDHELHQIVDQRYPQQHVQHVEHGVGHGDVEGDVRAATLSIEGVGRVGDQPLNEGDVEGEHRHKDDGTQNIEHRVGTGSTHGRGVRTDGSQLCRDGGADVLADDQRHRGIEVDDARGGQRDRDAQHRRAALDDDGQNTADHHTRQQAAQGARIEQVHVGDETGVVTQRGKGAAHELQTGEHKAQRHERLADGTGAHTLAGHHGVDAHAHQQKAVLAHLDRQNPARDGGADIGPENDANGLLQFHQAGIDQADGHHRGNAAGLHHGRDAEACQDSQYAIAGESSENALEGFGAA